jgi:hypothetical protein
MKELADLVSEGVNRMLDKMKMWLGDFNDIIESLPPMLKYVAFFIAGYLACFIF